MKIKKIKAALYRANRAVHVLEDDIEHDLLHANNGISYNGFNDYLNEIMSSILYIKNNIHKALESLEK
jgi:hypothetical protein|tara:strand:+ start:59 stop:262 length:204 start_codon:yes stop_codon:yes gene_type:complete